MKYSFAALALATIAAAKPKFTNTSFNPEEGKPFELTFSDCDSKCTIILQSNGGPNKLKDIQTLTTSASGDSATVTIKDVPTGQYNFKIFNNDDADNSDEWNYTIPFSFQGSGSASTTGDESTTGTPTQTGKTTESTGTDDATTTGTDASTETTEPASTTGTDATETGTESSTKTKEPAATTSVPGNSGANGVTAPIALVAGAAAAMMAL